jgi:hypothetical protein
MKQRAPRRPFVADPDRGEKPPRRAPVSRRAIVSPSVTASPLLRSKTIPAAGSTASVSFIRPAPRETAIIPSSLVSIDSIQPLRGARTSVVAAGRGRSESSVTTRGSPPCASIQRSAARTARPLESASSTARTAHAPSKRTERRRIRTA